MHCQYYSVSDCSIRVSQSFVQIVCPLHKYCTYYASICSLFLPTHYAKHFAGKIDGSLTSTECVDGKDAHTVNLSDTCLFTHKVASGFPAITRACCYSSPSCNLK